MGWESDGVSAKMNSVLGMISYALRGAVLAQTCDLCGKGPRYGNSVSHAHNLTRRRWNPNLRRVHALVEGTRKTLRVCTECIRAGKVTKVV